MANDLPALPDKGVRALVDSAHLDAIEHALALNDLSKLNTQQRVAYYNATCASVGLNPLTQPFAYILLDGKLTLYARKECSEQLRKINRVSTQVLSKQELPGDLYEVNVRVTDASGRVEEEVGIVSLLDKNGKRLTGKDLANAQMKALTKAKRRGTLAISGLGLLDESEIETIRNVNPADNPQIPNPFKEAGAPPETSASEDDIPENGAVLEEDTDADLGEFVCKVGKKYPGKKLKEFDPEELRGFILSTKAWFKENNKRMSDDWIEFFEKAERFLGQRDISKT